MSIADHHAMSSWNTGIAACCCLTGAKIAGWDQHITGLGAGASAVEVLDLQSSRLSHIKLTSDLDDHILSSQSFSQDLKLSAAMLQTCT